jgi:formate hydrogenlyase subunit 3/multisubunit Na+/H+ antiporter MnhD subunit
LAAAALVPVQHRVELPWLLLGTVLGLEDTGRIFLAFTSVLWLAAGIYGAGSMREGPHAARFRVFFLLAMAGNLWLIVGQDLVSFYLGFSLMGLASYGLVVHQGDRSALRAGKVYLVMTLIGELTLFAALVLIADHAGSLAPDRAALAGLGSVTVGLLIFGLAIKAGLVPVHVWLPLAHPAAPVPASAVLSGAMIKVALLGWLRFLPVGQEVLTDWGALLVFLGLASLFFAIPIGLVQSNPKVILAYSSVSKMGLMVLTLGLILLEPAFAAAGILALSLFAAHHALVKGGLFLGVGLRHHAGAQWLVLVGIVVLALSLAGVPPSSGAVAKYGIKPILAGPDWSWLTGAVTISTVGTGLLMARFLWVIWRTEPHPTPGYVSGGAAWGALVLLSLLFPMVLGTPAAWVSNGWPIGAAVLLALPVALVAWRKPRLLHPVVDLVRPGDLLVLIRPVMAALGFALRVAGRRWDRLIQGGLARWDAAVAWLSPGRWEPERTLRAWPSAGAAWLGVTALLLALGLWTPPDEWAWERRQVGARGSAAIPSPAKRVESPPGADDLLPTSPSESAPMPVSPAAGDANATAQGLDLPVPGGQVADRQVMASASTLIGAEAQPTAPSEVAEAPAPQAPAAVDFPPDARAPAVATPGAPAQSEPAASAGAERVACDLRQPFVFSHPAVKEPLRLVMCIQGAAGPRLLDAPPLTNPLVTLVQLHLNDLGYEAGPVDGLVGPRTRSAIRRFQQDQGADRTGDVTFDLLGRIRSATASALTVDPAGRGDQ